MVGANRRLFYAVIADIYTPSKEAIERVIVG